MRDDDADRVVSATPRLIATDLDGTLLRSDGTVSQRTARVLAAVERAGVPVVFVTGRPLRWMEVVREHVGAHGLAVCSNGAVVVDLRTDEPVLTRPIAVADALAVTAAIRAARPDVLFAVEDLRGFAMEPGYPALHARPAGTPVAPIAELLDGGPVKLMARDPGADPDGFLDEIVGLVAGRVVATRSDAVAMVEMSAAGVTKASTLAILCERFGVDAVDVVAFGDMPNDLAMLTWAGRSFAVAGAHPSLDAIVTDRAAGNDEDGVARALEGLLGLEVR